MPTLLWDASSLSKRYTKEQGSDSVDALFHMALTNSQVITNTGYIECYSILRRRFNSGIISAQYYATAKALLRREILEDIQFQLIPAEPYFLAGILLVDAYNINSSDAMILASYLDYRATLSATDLPAVLVASDHRLLRAARVEGIAVLDPEVVAANNIPGFMNTL